MSPLWALGLVWMVCGFTGVCESAVRASAGCRPQKKHGNLKYDPCEAVSCENTLHLGAGLSCCGNKTFSPSADTCCKTTDGAKITEGVPQGVHENVSACCGLEAYNKLNQICCDFTIVAKHVPNARCCDKKIFDGDKQLCCGPNGNKTILNKISSNHRCCYHDQYDIWKQCCIWMNHTLQLLPLNSSHCKPGAIEKSANDSVQQKQHICGKLCFGSGECENASTVYDPHTHICCDGYVFKRKSQHDQCCGQTPCGLRDRGVLCCNNVLHTSREDEEQYSENDAPYRPAKGTVCCSQFYGSPGKHCCGRELFNPHTEICCNGHRHSKAENLHCCGIKAYNITDPQMKCCSGTLHNVASLGEDVQCCGSLLQHPQDVCCSSGEEQLRYSAKKGFRCCGHHYYNTTVWSCCDEKLHSEHQQDHCEESGSRILSVDNLNKTDCNEMHIGTVESVSPHSIVFNNVLKISGGPLPSHYIWNISKHCCSLKLIVGETYFFTNVNVFTDFNQENVLHSLHYMSYKCRHG